MGSPLDETFVYAYMRVSETHRARQTARVRRAECIHFPSSSDIPSEDAEDPLEPNFIQLSPRAWLAAEAVTLLDFDKEPNESLEDVTEHEAAWQRNCQLLQTVFRPHLSNTSIKLSGSQRCLFLFNIRLSAVPDAGWKISPLSVSVKYFWILTITLYFSPLEHTGATFMSLISICTLFI